MLGQPEKRVFLEFFKWEELQFQIGWVSERFRALLILPWCSQVSLALESGKNRDK